jgi:hypothetical protein
MFRSARLWSGPFRLLMAFALIAMAIRAAVPVGSMLTADQGRWITVTLCSGSGPMQMALNLDTGEQSEGGEPSQEDDGKRGHHGPCVFAAAAGAAPPVLDAAVPWPAAAVAAAAVAFPASVMVGRGLAAPPPWATGPPTIA